MPSGSGSIPVEALLKLTLDKAGAKTIQDFMDQHEQSWGRIEQSISRVGRGVEGLARGGLDLLGVAGIGAVARNFMQTSQAGSNVALAAGMVTGGAGVWHPYGQQMLGAQAQTGVGATDIAQGLIMAIQGVGGSPTPQQAGILGALIAGFGQVGGLSPSQVSQVVTPILQASGKTLSAGNTLGALAGVSGALTNFPGSQQAPMLGLISQLALQQGLGTGGGINAPGLAGLVNAAAGANSLFRNPQVAGSAASGVSGGLQGAYSNPSMEAFLQMAGIGYFDQRKGITPGNVQAIMREATKMYPDPKVRDMALRSLFGGIPGADLLETFAPGSHAYNQLSHIHGGSVQGLSNQIHHAQQRTTPNADANRLGGNILHFLESSPLAAGAGILGILKGPGLLKKGLGSLARAFGGGAGAAGEDAGIGEALAGIGLKGLGLGVGTIGSMLLFPDSTSSGAHGSPGQVEHAAVQNALRLGKLRFGNNIHSAAARNYMQQQIYSGTASVYGSVTDNSDFRQKLGTYSAGAGQLLDQMLGNQYAPNGQDPASKLDRAATELLKAAGLLQHGSKFSAYAGGAGSQYVGLGAPSIQALGAIAPGMEFAALTNPGGAQQGQFVSFAGGGGGGGGGGGAGTPGGTGWQTCTLTWYDPALGGTNSGNGAKDPHHATASGTPYSATALTCAAPPGYAFGTKIQFAYGGQTVTCTVNDRGGAITGSHFDLSRGAASAIGMISAGRVTAKFRVISSGGGGQSSGGGASSVGAAGGVVSDLAGGSAGTPGGAMSGAFVPAGGGGAMGSPVVLHAHIHIDGRKVQQQRVLLGHKH